MTVLTSQVVGQEKNRPTVSRQTSVLPVSSHQHSVPFAFSPSTVPLNYSSQTVVGRLMQRITLVIMLCHVHWKVVRAHGSKKVNAAALVNLELVES
jgi:hypothetical protein